MIMTKSISRSTSRSILLYLYVACLFGGTLRFTNSVNKRVLYPLTSQHDKPSSLEQNVPEPPRLILHAGPHKTGSTSIQIALLRFQESLITDKFVSFWGFHPCGMRYFGGPKNPARAAFSLHQPNNCGPNSLPDRQIIHQQLAQQIAKTLEDKNNTTFILSSEELANPLVNLTLLTQVLSQVNHEHNHSTNFNPHLHTQIILYHRPVLPWLQSYYFELHRGQSQKEDFSSLVEWLNSSKTMEPILQEVPVRVAQKFREAGFHNIDLRPFPSSSDVTDDFLCRALSAPRTCEMWRQQQQQQQHSSSKKMNTRTSLEHFRVYHKAVQRGLVPPRIYGKPKHAGRLISKLEAELNVQSSSLPRICVSGALREQLKELAVSSVFPSAKALTEDETTETNDGIEKELDELCSLDVDRLFEEDPSWKSWFAQQSRQEDEMEEKNTTLY